MSPRLSNDDSCAVDLLLDREAVTATEINSCFSVGPSQVLQERLTRVEALLHVLDNYRAAEPSGDLVARTLERCDRAAQAKAAHATPAQPAITARPNA
jgi:hypothetical protein